MSLQFDAQHRWLVEQALANPLPAGFLMYVDPSDRAYYVRFSSEHMSERERAAVEALGGPVGVEVACQWDHPLIPTYSKLFQQGAPRWAAFLRCLHALPDAPPPRPQS
jgi:hypothetical protein